MTRSLPEPDTEVGKPEDADQEPRTLIVAYDPGKITGAAYWQSHPNTVEGKNFFADQYDVETMYQMVDRLGKQALHVQIEKFTISQATIRKARETEPLDIIGYLKYASWRDGFPIGWSKPADVMSTFTDAALRKAGMYTPGKGHANDATRHLAWYLVKKGIRPARDFLL